MSKRKKILTKLAIFAFIIMFAFINIAYAKTKADLNFCKQPGVIRMMKIIGLVIGVIKVAIPVLITVTAMIKFANVIIGGKDDEFKEAALTVIKKVIAGIIIFLIPGICHHIFTYVIKDSNTSNFSKCESCINRPESCTIPKTTPSYYTN